MTELAQECRRLHESAWQNFRRKNLPGAAQTCAELNQRFPRFAEGWFLGSQIAIEFGNLEKALEFAERASMVAPDELLYLVHKANCLMLIRRQPEALALANEIEAAKPHSAAVLA